MASDLRSVALKAAANALKQAGSGGQSQPPPEPKKPVLSTGHAVLLGAGLATAGRALFSSRGRDMVGSLRERLTEEPSGDEEYDEPEDEQELDHEEYDDEPESEEDEDFDDEDYEDEPESEEDDDFDDEDYEDEPESEEDEDFEGEEGAEDDDEEADEPPRRRRRSRSVSRNRG